MSQKVHKHSQTAGHACAFSPGMRPRFFNQKMEQKEPEKKMPSTHAKATSRSAKLSALHTTGAGKVTSETRKCNQAAFQSELCRARMFVCGDTPAPMRHAGRDGQPFHSGQQACTHAWARCFPARGTSTSCQKRAPADPLECPLRLLLHHRHGLDGVEQPVLLLAAGR